MATGKLLASITANQSPLARLFSPATLKIVVSGRSSAALPPATKTKVDQPGPLRPPYRCNPDIPIPVETCLSDTAPDSAQTTTLEAGIRDANMSVSRPDPRRSRREQSMPGGMKTVPRNANVPGPRGIFARGNGHQRLFPQQGGFGAPIALWDERRSGGSEKLSVGGFVCSAP